MKKGRQLKALYKRYLQNESSGEEVQQFFRHIADPENEREIRAHLSRTWDKWAQEENYSSGKSVLRFLAGKPWHKAAVAAILLTASALFWRLSLPPLPENLWHERVAGLREQVQVRLPDSSLVWLQPLAKLRYPRDFDKSTREVYLDGRALFEVRKNTQKAFLVHAGELKVRVLGTSFDVDAHPDDTTVRVTVIHGMVEVADLSGPLEILSASQQLNYSKGDGAYHTLKTDTAAYMSAIRGQFRFEEIELGHIVRELERWYGVRFSFGNEALRQCRYTASFMRSLKLEEILSMLCDVNNLSYTVDAQGNIVLEGRACHEEVRPWETRPKQE